MILWWISSNWCVQKYIASELRSKANSQLSERFQVFIAIFTLKNKFSCGLSSFIIQWKIHQSFHFNVFHGSYVCELFNAKFTFNLTFNGQQSHFQTISLWNFMTNYFTFLLWGLARYWPHIVATTLIFFRHLKVHNFF